MKPKHTEGPWIILDHYEPNRILINSGVFPNSTPIAEIISAGYTKRANAHLIAAAPEMLEALETMIAYWRTQGWFQPGGREDLEKIMELVKRVRGSNGN